MASLGKALRTAQSHGRYGDTILAHINPEEARHLRDRGGSGTINPETGLPEFFSLPKLFKGITQPITTSLKVLQNPTSKDAWMGVAKNATDADPGDVLPAGVQSVIKKAAPAVLSYINPLLGAAYSGVQSYGQNGNAVGALANAGASYLGGSGAGVVPAALAGAGASKLNGGSNQDALVAGLGNGFSSYMSSGGLSGGETPSQTGMSSGGDYSGDGSWYGTAAQPLQGPTMGSGAPLSGVAGGTGILGAATRGLSGLGSALSTGTGGGGSSYGGLNALSSLASGAYGLYANDKAKKDLEGAGNNALSQIQPYQASGLSANTRLSELLGTGGNKGASDYGSLSSPFNPGDLTQDPGYQFQLQEGQKALDRQQAARGGYFSGAAIKQGQEFGQGLADQTYKDAFARDAQQKQQTYGMYSGQAGAGQSAANNAAGIYENMGNAKAAAGINGANIVNQSLSSLLSGSGAKRFLGYGQNGQPIYV